MGGQYGAVRPDQSHQQLLNVVTIAEVSPMGLKKSRSCALSPSFRRLNPWVLESMVKWCRLSHKHTSTCQITIHMSKLMNMSALRPSFTPPISTISDSLTVCLSSGMSMTHVTRQAGVLAFNPGKEPYEDIAATPSQLWMRRREACWLSHRKLLNAIPKAVLPFRFDLTICRAALE
jgi:hypothetical protein